MRRLPQQPTRTLVFLLAVAAVACGTAEAQLRIVTYNTLGPPREFSWAGSPVLGTTDVLEGIGLESVNGIAKPIDVLLLQEQDSITTTTQDFVGALNGVYGAGVYARGNVNATTLGGGRPTIVYNTQTVQLLSETQIGSVSGSGAARAPMRYRLLPVGYGADAAFYVYNSHYKASTGSTNEARRLAEATTIRADADALGDGTNILYAGDFNIRSSSEDMYQHLLSSGNGQAFDPVNTPATWHNNNSPSVRIHHTQSPVTSSRFSHNGNFQVTGGMDDRFDFQLATGEMLDGEGLAYIPNSYHAYGNNGSLFCCNNPIDSAFNTALTPDLRTAIANASDHLPVVADYQLPAVQSAGLGSTPARVLIGATLGVDVDVANSANVVAAIGADELDYTVIGAGAASGTVNDTALALAGPNTHQLTLDTSTTGQNQGVVTVFATSEAAANGNFVGLVNYDVLDHAEASFNGASDDDTLAIDFGIVRFDSGTASDPVDLFNLEAAAGFTADLEVTGVNGSGNTAALGVTLGTATIAAGGSTSFDATLDTGSLGTFSATYTLSNEDEALLGAMTGADLTLTLDAVVAMPGDLNLDHKVDGFDLFTLAGNLNGPATSWLDGDFDGNGMVDAADVGDLAANWLFGATGPASPEMDALLAELTVPEPASGALLLLLTAPLLRRRAAR